MQKGTKQHNSFWHSPLGVSSLAAFVIALKVGLRKFVAVGASWIVGFVAGVSLLNSGASHQPSPGSAAWYCEGAVREKSCVNLIETFTTQQDTQGQTSEND